MPNFITNHLSEIIACSALFVAVQQAYLTRRHNRLSVKPHLTIDTKVEQTSFAVNLVNNGLGPAIIKDFKIELNEICASNKNSQELEVILEALFPANSSITNNSTHISTVATGYIMAQNKPKEILRAGFREKDRSEVMKMLTKLKFTVTYESFYGDPGKFSTEENHLTN